MSFLIAQIVSERELARRGHDVEATAVSDVLFAALVGTMLGAKLYYVVVLTHNISDLWSRGGFVFWGGFIGAVTLCWHHDSTEEVVVRALRRRRRNRHRGGVRRRTHRLLGRRRRLRQAVHGTTRRRISAGRAAVDGRRDDARRSTSQFRPGTARKHGRLRLSRRSCSKWRSAS